MKFGDNLKNIRKYKKISQEDLAEKLGVSRQSISKWETGENYPSMTNIMCLCTIFNCKINELVHEDMVDIDSLDEEIKMSVVKFKKNEQKKMKKISKFIYVSSKVGRIIASIGLVVSIIFSIITLSVVSSMKIDQKNKEIVIFNEKAKYELSVEELSYIKDSSKTVLVSNLSNEEVETINKVINLSKPLKITIVLLIAISLIGTLIIIIKITTYIEKLFKNIHDNDTPFNMDNVFYMKKLSIYTVLYFALSDIMGLIAQAISSIDFNIEIQPENYILSIIVLALSYVFKYGYEIQLDSKGKIYGDINE